MFWLVLTIALVGCSSKETGVSNARELQPIKLVDEYNNWTEKIVREEMFEKEGFIVNKSGTYNYSIYYMENVTTLINHSEVVGQLISNGKTTIRVDVKKYFCCETINGVSCDSKYDGDGDCKVESGESGFKMTNEEAGMSFKAYDYRERELTKYLSKCDLTLADVTGT